MTFPRYNELESVQKDAVDVPLERNLLLVGAPGTGKSAVVLHRVAQAARKSVVVWTYNHMLAGYLRRRQSELEQNVLADTFYTWFWGWWYGRFNERPPLLNEGTPFSPPDFDECARRLRKEGTSPRPFEVAFVDEGQDLPVEAFRFVQEFVAQSLTVTADSNQMLETEGASLEQLRHELGGPEVVELTRNYRNSARIQAFASHYHTDDAVVRPQNVTGLEGDSPLVLGAVTSSRVVEVLANLLRRMPAGRHAAVIVCGGVPATGPDQLQDTVLKLQSELSTRLPGLPVRSYVGRKTAAEKRAQANAIRLSEPGVTVLSQWANKGLEFDWVVAVRFDRLFRSIGAAEAGMTPQRLAYVLATRTRERLLLTMPGRVEDLAAEAARLPPPDVYEARNYA